MGAGTWHPVGYEEPEGTRLPIDRDGTPGTDRSEAADSGTSRVNPYTAVIHLRDPIGPSVRTIIEPKLRLVRGVHEVDIDPGESAITIQFDRELTGLSEIVQRIEEVGSAVSSVAQRRLG